MFFNKKKDIELLRENLIILQEEKQTENKIGDILNSPKFEEVVYTDRQKKFMKLVLEELKRGKQLHLLFSGFAGTGKTFSSKMISCETKKPFVYLNGQMNQKKIRDILLNLKPNSIVLIDEIHNLSEKVAETIYPAIEYNEISFDGKTISLDSNPVFIGTTTEPQKLPKPLQARLFRIEFEEPDEKQAIEILKKMGLGDDIIKSLLLHTLNIRQLKKLISYMDLYGGRGMKQLQEVFEMMKIDFETGLSLEQQDYMKFLRENGRASVRNLSLVLRRSEEYIKGDIEPELIRKQLIRITSRGRELN